MRPESMQPTAPNSPAIDARYLTAAARLSLRGRSLSYPNPNVGVLIVKDGRVLAQGWTAPGGRPHAEAAALRVAGENARGATLYTTLEPCAHVSARGPACSDLIAEAGVARVVYAVRDPDPRTDGRGAERLRQAGIEVTAQANAAAEQSLAGFLTRRILGRPHVTLKLALSLDGQIALADGSSRWITGDEARAHVHSRRALADAILVGGATWRTDRPRLDVRLPNLEDRSPTRVVLTRGAAPEGVEVVSEPEHIARLSAHWLYIEGGAGAAAAFLRADLVDRLELYSAPILIGAGRAALGDLGLHDLAEAHGRWDCVEERPLGKDRFAAYTRERPIGPLST